MKERYKTMLEKVYEVEGLLLLALSKEEMPEGLETLIERRVSELLEDEDEGFYSLEDEDDEVENTDHASAGYEEAERMEHPGKEKRHSGSIRKTNNPIFSLNDRFLFVRELFGGDNKAFNKAIDRIAAADNFEEAEDYLVGECGLNPEERETDARFMSIVETGFKSASNHKRT